MENGQNKVGARFWHRFDEQRIQCDVCPRQCIIPKNGRGFCFVRQNIDGKMVSTTYGRSSGFCMDPIEKKPLNHFYPGSKIFSFGTAGCNLGCKFCQNWDISKAKEDDRLTEKATPKMIASAAQYNNCKSVAFTYNDPVIFTEYAIDTSIACHDAGIMTVAVTAGYIRDKAREEFFSHMDAANVDLKSFTDQFYREMAFASLNPVLDTLCYIKERTNVWLEITNLIIPGKNDSDDEIDAMTQWIVEHLGSDVPLHFSAFHPAFNTRDIPRTPASTLTKAREIAIRNGIKYVYTGNVRDVAGGSTYCHKCQHLLIERNWYQIGEYNLIDSNKCKFCNTICAGCF